MHVCKFYGIAKHTMVSDIGKAAPIKTTKILPLLQFEKPTKDMLSQISLRHHLLTLL